MFRTPDLREMRETGIGEDLYPSSVVLTSSLMTNRSPRVDFGTFGSPDSILKRSLDLTQGQRTYYQTHGGQKFENLDLEEFTPSTHSNSFDFDRNDSSRDGGTGRGGRTTLLDFVYSSSPTTPTDEGKGEIEI